MAVAAELDIQNDIKHETMLSPKCKLCKWNTRNIYTTSRFESIKILTAEDCSPPRG